ncbi:hypothetical protein [Aquitalea sp. FJL05]|nr:hypothetical protein [Aquitalea sp. FJL05]
MKHSNKDNALSVPPRPCFAKPKQEAGKGNSMKNGLQWRPFEQ